MRVNVLGMYLHALLFDLSTLIHSSIAREPRGTHKFSVRTSPVVTGLLAPCQQDLPSESI